MESTIVTVRNRLAYILGDFSPGTLLQSSSGAVMLAVSRTRKLDENYVELLKIAKDLSEGAEVTSISKALIVSDTIPHPGETVAPYEWPAVKGIVSPEGPADLLTHHGIPHL